jgi:hypothetical protein
MLILFLPRCRNGSRCRLKIDCSHGRVGSSPIWGTIEYKLYWHAPTVKCRSVLFYYNVIKQLIVLNLVTYMKLRVTFDFEFEDSLTQDEVDGLIYIVEGWAEHDGAAFLEIPGGFKDVDIGYEFVKQNK